MRLLSYSHDGRSTYGAVLGDDTGVVDLAPRIDGVRNLSDLLSQQRLDEARSVLAHLDRADAPLDEVTYDRTFPAPGKIFCIGVNYGGRNAEYQDDQDAPNKPSVFVRFPSSFTGHEHDLVRPPESPQLDYEGEIVAVIGKGGRRIQRADARHHIAGLTLGNEGTIRDWVRHAKFNVTQGKNWDSSGSIGPWMVTIDETRRLRASSTSRLASTANSDRTTPRRRWPTRSSTRSSTCRHSARWNPATSSSPARRPGAGARFDPPRFLEPGDVVEVTVPELGTLRNGVRDE